MHNHFYTLENGLKVLLIDTKTFPSLTTLLLVGSGSRYENEKNNGIAHFFEHMAFKGSKKYPTSQIIAEIIEGLGGLHNAFTSIDHTGYYVKAPAEDAETVVDVLADMIQTPILREEDIKREKGVIVQEINMYEDMPQRKVYEIFETLLYPDQPLGYDIIGTKDTVTSFTRKTFTDYIDQLYHPNNTVLIMAGGLTSGGGEKDSAGGGGAESGSSGDGKAESGGVGNGKAQKNGARDLDFYKKIISDRFASWKQAETLSPKKVKESQSEQAFLLQEKKTEQAHFCLGYRSFSRTDERRYALSILTTILGGGMSSRLFKEVREKRGLCYAVRTYVDSFDDAGYVATYVGVESSEAKAQEAIKVVLEEHSKLTSIKVSAEELKKAKEMIKGRLILSLEDSMNIASIYGRKMIFENEVFSMDDVIGKVEAVSADEVQNLAGQLFVKESLNLAMIGPFKNAGSFRRLLV